MIWLLLKPYVLTPKSSGFGDSEYGNGWGGNRRGDRYSEGNGHGHGLGYGNGDGTGHGHGLGRGEGYGHGTRRGGGGSR
jgi:hypothetical protein